MSLRPSAAALKREAGRDILVGEGVRAFEIRPPGSLLLLDTRTFGGSSLLMARYAVER